MSADDKRGTVIAAHARVVGSLIVDKGENDAGNLVVEGHVDGSVRCAGQLTLGRKAQVTGELEAHDVRIAGVLHRSVRAVGVIHLLATAVVHGDLEAGRVVIDDGALFEGQVRLRREPPMQRAAPPSQPVAARAVPELAAPGRRRLQRRIP